MMPHSPQRTSAAGPYEATGKGGALWCMGSCSQMSYHADGGMSDKCGYRTYREQKPLSFASSHDILIRKQKGVMLCVCICTCP